MEKLEDDYCSMQDEAKAYAHMLAGGKVIGPGGFYYRYNDGIEKLFGKYWTPWTHLYSGEFYILVPLKSVTLP